MLPLSLFMILIRLIKSEDETEVVEWNYYVNPWAKNLHPEPSKIVDVSNV